ncbi:TonB-dependent receptor [Pseudoalteromonas sp. BDTF-M6]|nr:TonB-dependent receptor [Pseudoalteromonas sp. BDTF-M6]
MRFSLSLLTIALSAPLHAEQTAQSLEHIIVTGSRVVENIDEVPASVTVITREQIQAQLRVSPELQNLLEVLVPGMAPSTNSSSNTGQTLRGRAPLIMIDGVPQSTPLRNGSLGIRSLDPSVLERIEVIKGATSVYGNGAAGGVINYITKKPSNGDDFSASVDVSTRFSAVKSDETLGARVEGSINGRLDKFSYLATLSYEENGVQRDAEGDILGLQYGLSDVETENYFTKLGYDFDAEKSLSLTYNYYKSQQKTDLGDVFGDINQGDKSYAIHVPAEQQKQGRPQGPSGNTNIMIKYSDSEVFTNTALTVDLYAQDIENVFFYSPNLANPSAGYDGGQSIIASKKEGLRATFNSQFDLQGTEATFIYGVDLLNDVTSQPLVDGRVWVPEMDMSNLAGFVQSKWVIDEHYVIKAGVRHEDIDLEVDDYRTLELCRSETQCSVPIDVKGDTLNYTATTYNVGLKYNAFETFSPFISYSQGADISDIGRLLRTATVNDIALIRTEASVIDNYEVGFTSVLDRLRLEGSLYRSTSELGTTNSFDETTGVYMPVRAPQEIWGYELLADYRFSPAWRTTLTYAYVEGKNTQDDVYLGAKQISPPKATANLQWQPSRETSLSLTLLYVGNRKRFEPNADGDYVGDQGPVNDYLVVNVSGQHQFTEQLNAYFGVENLFNRDYYPARAQAYTYGGYNIKGLGTSITAGLKYQF